MPFSSRALVVACLASSTPAALASAPAVAAPASAAIAGTQGQHRLTFQVPGDYAQQGSLTEGGPLNGRFVASHELASGVSCTTAMTVRGLVRKAAQRPVRDGSVVRWRVGRRAESLSRVDAAGRLADGGRWWTSARSSIDTGTEFPTAEADPYFRFGIADVRAPGRLPAGRSVLVQVVVTTSPARECRDHARRRLPADVRRVLRHLDVAGSHAGPHGD